MFFNILCLLTNLCLISAQNVPLLVWTSDDLPHCSPEVDLYPEQSVSTVFNSDYMNCLNVKPPENILVFLVEGLTIEHITVYGSERGCFKNVQQQVQSYGYSVPSVESANIFDDIKMTMSRYFTAASFLANQFEQPVDQRGFEELDQHIATEIQKVDGSYIAVLSSDSPGSMAYQHEYNTGRHLLSLKDDAKGNGSCLIGKCVQMCFSEIVFNSNILTPTVSSFTKENCSTTSNEITFVAKPSGASGSTTVTMTFTSKVWGMSGLNWWALSNIDVVDENGTSNFQSSSTYPEFTAPYSPELNDDKQLWSVGCASPSGFQNKTTKAFLNFKDLQVQAFSNERTTTFYNTLDCSGWFTGPIWAGLLVSLLLLTMLTYAFGMISSITTMDKFDNPKGKTISVPQES